MSASTSSSRTSSLIVWGYALLDRISLPSEISTMLGGGIYPGMITATVGTALLIAVVVSLDRDRPAAPSLRGVVLGPPDRLRRRSRSPGSTRSRPATSSCSTRSPPTTGAASTSRRSRCSSSSGSCAPLVNAFRYRLRVAEVVAEGPGVVSLRIGGRRLDRLHARAGPVLPLALPHRAAAGGRRTRSRSRRRPTAARSGSR